MLLGYCIYNLARLRLEKKKKLRMHRLIYHIHYNNGVSRYYDKLALIGLLSFFTVIIFGLWSDNLFIVIHVSLILQSGSTELA